MKNSFIRKPISVLLSLLMVLSVFGGMAFTASAESKTIAEGVIFKLGDTIVLPGNGIYYVKASERHPAQEICSNGTVDQFEGDEYSYTLRINEWDIYTYLDTFAYWEEMNQGLSVLGITFTGSGTESDPYMLKLAFGEIESTWAGDGEGTEDAPWLIKDLNDLRTLSANVASGMTYSGKFLKVTDNIDCGSDSWEPIGGANAKMFMGTFDGDGKTITYSIISSENDTPKGLFAEIGSAGTVKNLNVAGSIVNTAEYAGPAGGIAAYNYGLIENCYSAVDITKGCDRGTGGIAAFNEEGATIRYCAASGTLTWTGASGFYACIGGITSEVYESTVTNSTSLCNVLAENAQDSSNYAGIFIGRNVNNYATPECYYLSTAATAGFVNKDSAEPKTPDELKAIGQAAYDAGYTVYGLALGAVASNPDQEAADAVIALIDAIGTVAMTDECKQKIDAARNAFDALTVPQKELISVEITNKLEKAEADYDGLVEDAFVDYREQQVDTFFFSMNELIGGYDEELSRLVSDYGCAISEVSIDSSKSLAENKAAVDTVVTAKTNALTTMVQEKLSSYQAQKIAEVQALAQDGDEFEVQIDIETCVHRIQDATLELDHSLDSAKNHIDSVVEELKTTIADRRVEAFNNYKTQKISDVQALAQNGDSAAATKIISDAVAAIDALRYDTTKTPAQNKAAVDAAANISLPLEEQRAADALAADKDAFDAYKSTKKADVQALALDGDSDTTTQIISDAVAAIDALSYDESKTLDENKTAVDDLVANVPTAVAAQRAADALAAAKRTAKIQLLSYKDSHDYRAEQKTELSNAIDNGIAAIDAATNIAAVNAAVEAAKDAMDAIPTDAELTAQEEAAALAAAKNAAKAALDTYKSADDYRTAEKEALASAIAEAKAAIDAAADIAAVNAAVAAAHTAMDAIKTDAELTAEEEAAALAAAKNAAKAALDTYKSADDYRTAEKEALANAIAEAKAAIDAAADIAAVDAAVEAAHTAMDAIKTDADLTAEEEAAAAAAALADAKAQLTTAVKAAKAFYNTIKGNEKYATIADALNTAIERAESALASEDASEVLDFAENVAFALETAQTDKAAADAEPTDEPSTPDTPDTPSDENEGKTGNSFLYNIIKAVVDFIVSLFTKVLPAAMKLK